MNCIGIDIGSTASKICVIKDNSELDFFVMPTGWNSKITSRVIDEKLKERNIDVREDSKIVATGYGRISVEYADKIITEISCHARGGFELFKNDCSIIDIGGQDTKLINVINGKAVDFLMNDKCAAGTGKFIEVMANRLGVTIDELFDMAKKGVVIPISSLCTVFAESEVINYMGEGKSKEDLSAGIVDSVATKVINLIQKKELFSNIILTGGLSYNEYFAGILSKKLKRTIIPIPKGKFAGAYGAALFAKKLI